MPTTERNQEIRRLCDAAARRRARIIGMAAWYDCADEVLTDAEKAEVRALWDTMSGSSCWNGAFLEWIRLPT